MCEVSVMSLAASQRQLTTLPSDALGAEHHLRRLAAQQPRRRGAGGSASALGGLQAWPSWENKKVQKSSLDV